MTKDSIREWCQQQITHYQALIDLLASLEDPTVNAPAPHSPPEPARAVPLERPRRRIRTQDSTASYIRRALEALQPATTAQITDWIIGNGWTTTSQDPRTLIGVQLRTMTTAGTVKGTKIRGSKRNRWQLAHG